MKRRLNNIFQLAEDYKLELNEAKAKITNFAYQVSSLKEQNKNLLDEMAIQLQTKSDEITKSKEEMRDLTSKLTSKLEVIFKRIYSLKLIS